MTAPATRAATGRFTRRRLLLGVVFVYVAYLLVANAFINSPLATNLINRKPEKFAMGWSVGLSAWPGQVMLWNVSLRGHVRRTAWSVEADRASGYIAPLHLFWKELRVPRVSGTGIVARVTRVDEEMPPPEPRDDAFVLQFSRISVDTPLRAHLFGIDVSGEAHGNVGWRQQLRGGPMELFPSTLRLDAATIARKDETWIHGAQLTADAAIAEHLRREFPGADVLKQLDARLQLQGVANALAIDYRQDVPDWAIADGVGTVVADLTLQRGVFEPGGRFAVRLPIQSTLRDGSTDSGDADIEFSVDDGLRLQATLPPVDVLRSDARFDLTLPTRDLPLPPWREQIQRIDGIVSLHSRFDSLGWITPLLERLKGLTLDGSGELRASLQIVDGTLAPGSSVTVDRADLTLVAFDHHIEGSAHAQADVIVDATAGQGAAAQRLRAKVFFDRFGIAAADAVDAKLGTGRNLELDLYASGALDQLRDTMVAQLDFKNAELPDLTLFNRYLPSHGARLLHGRGTLAASMRMDVPSERSSGQVRFDARRAGLRVGDLAFTTDVALDARLADGVLGDQRFLANGSSVRFSNARIDSPKGERAAPWWATLQLEQGDVSLRRPLLVNARGRARMQDIGFVLSLFSAKKDFPKWIARLLDAGEATVEGQLQLADHEVVVDRVNASNDRFDVQARLRLGERKPTGDLYARWGVLGLGMELKDGERDMRMVGAKKWFESRPNYLPE